MAFMTNISYSSWVQRLPILMTCSRSICSETGGSTFVTVQSSELRTLVCSHSCGNDGLVYMVVRLKPLAPCAPQHSVHPLSCFVDGPVECDDVLSVFIATSVSFSEDSKYTDDS